MARRVVLLVLAALLAGCASSAGPLPMGERGIPGAPQAAGPEAGQAESAAHDVVIETAPPELPPVREAGAERVEADAAPAEAVLREAAVQPAAAEPPPAGEEDVAWADAATEEVAITAAAERSSAGEATGLEDLAGTLGRALGEDADAFGIVIEHVPSGVRLVHNHRRVFRAASVYKLAVAHEVLRRVDAGTLSLDDPLVVTVADATEPEPDGGLAPGDEVTVREGLRAMMSVSSNAAAHAFLRRIGYQHLDETLAGFGLGDTAVGRAADGYARTTPADMAHLLGLVARERTLSEASRAELRRLLALREEPDGLAEALPDEVEVLSKAGNLARASNVAGLVATPGGPIIVAVFDEDMDPEEARATIGEMARAVVAFYDDTPGLARRGR